MACDYIVLQRKPFAFEVFFCWANAQNTWHSSDIKPIDMSEHSEAEKSRKSIILGTMHYLFGKNRQKYINLHNKTALTYFKTSLTVS